MKRYSTAAKIGGFAALILGACLVFPILRSSSSPPGLLSHELEYKGETPLSDDPIFEGLSMREFAVATVFPRFAVTGTVSDAIQHLMEESAKFSPNKFNQIGGFIVEGQDRDLSKRPVNINENNRNSLELINEICRQADCRWTFRPFNIRLSLPEDPE